MAYSQANQGGQDPGYVEVFEISGLLDDVLADALDNAISAAERNNANALILQVNSKQAVISDSKLMEIANHIQSSVIPIEVWVGPSGSTAQGKVAQLVLVADSLGVSIGSSIGKTGKQILQSGQFGQTWEQKKIL